MTIETKYNVGDEVWFMCDDKAVSEKINCIRTYRNGYSQYDSNTYGFEGILDNYRERDLFPTKADLLNSL